MLYRLDAMMIGGTRMSGNVRVTGSPAIIVEVISASNSRMDTQANPIDCAKLPSPDHA